MGNDWWLAVPRGHRLSNLTVLQVQLVSAFRFDMERITFARAASYLQMQFLSGWLVRQ